MCVAAVVGVEGAAPPSVAGCVSAVSTVVAGALSRALGMCLAVVVGVEGAAPPSVAGCVSTVGALSRASGASGAAGSCMGVSAIVGAPSGEAAILSVGPSVAGAFAAASETGVVAAAGAAGAGDTADLEEEEELGGAWGLGLAGALGGGLGRGSLLGT